MLSRDQLIANINAMEAQGAPQEDIQSYLDSQKMAFATPEPVKVQSNVLQSAGNFLLDIGKNVASTLVTRPGIRAGQALGAVTANIAGALGNKELESHINTKLQQPYKDPLTGVVTQPITQTKQAIGEGVESASLLFPYGRAASSLKPVVGSAVSKIASGAAGGYLADVGFGLQDPNKTTDEALKPGLGTLIGAAIPGASVAKQGISKVSESSATRVIDSLIKPLKKDFSYGKDPGRAVAGIVANSWDDLIQKIGQERRLTGSQLGELADKAQLAGAPTVSGIKALTYLDEAMSKAAQDSNQTLLQRLVNVKRSLTEDLFHFVDETGASRIVSSGIKKLDDLTLKDGIDLNRRIGDLTQWTGNISDDKAVNMALKRVYGTLKEEIEKSVDKTGDGKAFRELKERYGDLTSAEVSAKYREQILQRQNLISFGAKTSGTLGALVAAILTGGAAIPTILVGIGAVGLQKLLASPAAKTRLAAALAKLAPSERSRVLGLIPGLQEALKNNTFFPGDQFAPTKLGEKTAKYIEERQIGNGIRKTGVGPGVAEKIHHEDIAVMFKFIDGVRLKQHLPSGIEIAAQHLAENFGINVNKSAVHIANVFEDILSGKKKVRSTIPQARDWNTGQFK